VNRVMCSRRAVLYYLTAMHGRGQVRRTPDRELLLHESIAVRAYDKWVARGRPLGTAVQDWLEAEAELKAKASERGGL
jgi:hypothetical protein